MHTIRGVVVGVGQVAVEGVQEVLHGHLLMAHLGCHH